MQTMGELRGKLERLEEALRRLEKAPVIRRSEEDTDGRYRWRLARTWDDTKPSAVWIMLNPSTADGMRDDPTIRRCIRFGLLWGFGGIEVVNLFPWRATDPRDLIAARERGEDISTRRRRDCHVRRATRYGKVRPIAAWGAHALAREEWPTIPGAKNMLCLGTTKSGAPRHPLYVPYAEKLRPWVPPSKTLDTSADHYLEGYGEVRAGDTALRLLDMRETPRVQAESVACPTCGAGPHLPCLRPNGREANKLHKARGERAVMFTAFSGSDETIRGEEPA